VDKRLRVLVGILTAKYKQCRRETGRVRVRASLRRRLREISTGVGDRKHASQRGRD